MTASGSPAEFILGLGIVFALTVYLVRKYGDPKISFPVKAIVVLCWFFSFCIVIILPMDVSSTFYVICMRQWYCDSYVTDGNPDLRGCNETVLDIQGLPGQCSENSECHCDVPWSFIDENLLTVFWNIVYWSSQLFTWLVLPISEGYMSAGDFTFGQKLRSSLRENALVYGSLGAIVLVVAIILIAEGKVDGSSGLMDIAMIASNTWGLVAVVVLLGFGLVDIPRKLLAKSTPKKQMRRYQFRVAKLSMECQEAEESEDEILGEVRALAGQIKLDNPLRKYINIILLRSNITLVEGDYEDYNSSAADKEPTRKSLAKLHAKVKKTRAIVHRCRCQMEETMTEALQLQCAMKNKAAAGTKFVEAYGPPSRFPTLKWAWEVRVKPVITYLLLAVCIIMSLLLVWSEVVFFAEDPVLSVYALIIEHAGSGGNYINLEFLVFITLLYLAVCTFTVIFEIRLFNFYYLVPNRQTDSSSMIFSAMALSRLTAPLCLNFIAMAHLDGNVASTFSQQPLFFTQIQGHLKMAAEFSKYYPMIILVISIASIFRLGSRVLTYCGIQQSYVENDQETEELCTDGKILINREKRIREREGTRKTNFLATTEKMVDRPESVNAEADEEDLPTSQGRYGKSGYSSKYKSKRSKLHLDDEAELGSDSLVDDISLPSSRSKSKATSNKRRYKNYKHATVDNDDDNTLITSSKSSKVDQNNLFDDL